MYTCSITGMPFDQNTKAVLIPVLISKDFTDTNISNRNIRPFPVSVHGYFSEELFIIDKKYEEHKNFMMNMISSVLGKNIKFEDFQQLRGNDKEVVYDDKDYIINFFACHQNIYNSIISEFKTPGFISKNKIDFKNYCQEFVYQIINETSNFPKLINEPYKTKLGSNRTGFIIPDNFEEVHLSYFAEIKFINTFLSTIGKKWEPSGICSYNSNLAFDIYKNSILNLK